MKYKCMGTFLQAQNMCVAAGKIVCFMKSVINIRTKKQRIP